MPSYGLVINHAALNAKIQQALANSVPVKRLTYNKAYGIYYRAKRTMLNEFDRHLVTQEIAEGNQAANISGTLDGYGNLFSFIGFIDGSDPTSALRDLLDVGTDFQQTVFRNSKWYFKVRTPSQEAIASVTPMPWETGNGWAEGIEKGISGLGYYIYKRWEKGHSKMGVQLPWENWGDNLTFTPTPYLTEILGNFREKVNNK
jgi:hypothetical protein